METQQQKSLEKSSTSVEETDNKPDKQLLEKSPAKRQSWPLLLGAIALFAGGAMVLHAFSRSQQFSEEAETNMEKN